MINQPFKLFIHFNLLSLVILLLGSCSSKTWPVNPVYSQILIPDLNISVVSELGDTLVDQGHMTTRNTLEIDFDIQAKTEGLKLYLGKGSYLEVNQNEKYTFYHPLNATTKGITLFGQDIVTTDVGVVGFAISKSDGTIKPFSDGSTGFELGVVKGQAEILYARKQIQVKSSSSFRQQLIYNGRVDNNLRFIYREFSNDLARGSFTQQMQYDFSESNIIGFKGVRVEVIKASNTQIEYKVLSHFRGELY